MDNAVLRRKTDAGSPHVNLTRRMFCGSLLATAVAGREDAVADALAAGTPKRWYKGMLHCHTYWSDGRAFPEQAAQAYYDCGYHFFCLSDHNRFAANPDYWRDVREDEGPWPKNVYRPIFESYRKRFPDADIRERDGKAQVRIKTFDEIKTKFDKPGRFLVLPGMEVTRTNDCGANWADNLHVHMNYVNLHKGLPSAEQGPLVQGYGKTVSEIIGKTKAEVDALAKELGNPPHLFMVNHPVWRFFDVTAQDIIDHPEVRFFEICNGGSDAPSERYMPEADFSGDRIWDVVLAHRCRAGGALLYGVGSDDAHWYPNSGTPEPCFPFADGYIQVRAEELTAEALIAAMDRGDFYASCGVDLEDVTFDKESGTLAVSVPAKVGTAYRIRFVGTKKDFDGEVKATLDWNGNRKAALGKRKLAIHSDTIGITLKEVAGKRGERVAASYTLGSDDLYVRAIVESDDKATAYGMKSPNHPKVTTAWTQPYRA